MDIASLDKARVLAALQAHLERDLSAAMASQERTQSGATHEESRPENEKDTRALESSYLARGQAQRVAELSRALASLSALELRRFDSDSSVALSALLSLDDGERAVLCFLAPVGGGLGLQVEAATVIVLTPQSPLGRALLGRRVGDEVEVQTPQGIREYSVLGLA
jgi:hypothetical protein